MDFWWFLAARHISRANCAETNWNRHGQAAYEIFRIERRFRRYKSRFSRFKETCSRGHQIAVLSKSHVEKAGDRLTVCEQQLL